MKFLVIIYIDDKLMQALPEGRFDEMMRGCLQHADELRASGCLLDAQQLETPASAKTLRIRQGTTHIVDGPFAETKEYLGGFNLIEADNFDEAMKIAREFPWASVGSIEVREIRDMEAVRLKVGG